MSELPVNLLLLPLINYFISILRAPTKIGWCSCRYVCTIKIYHVLLFKLLIDTHMGHGSVVKSVLTYGRESMLFAPFLFYFYFYITFFFLVWIGLARVITFFFFARKPGGYYLLASIR